MENKPTIQEVVRKAKTTGIIVSNIDLPEIMNYLNKYESTTKFEFIYNSKPGYTTITPFLI